MPDSEREITATRIAVMELKDERQLVREGYELLDEKRMLLAAQIQRELKRFRCSAARKRRASARFAFPRARCGAPPRSRRAVGLSASIDARRGAPRDPPLAPVQLGIARGASGAGRANTRSSRTARQSDAGGARLRRGAAQWLHRAVELAACSVNLRRLVRDYVRTERRARAIENVLMPEIESAIKIIEEQLEGMDQEEIARLRQRRPNPA